jgi:predicted ATPase/class 3 adenylate cyclase
VTTHAGAYQRIADGCGTEESACRASVVSAVDVSHDRAMSALPRGTVTFLFTDVEGSTRLLDELGPEAYALALERHRAALRDAFRRHGGVEVDTQGDAFFVAFPTAPGAVAAASEATSALAAGPIRARMGIHTGTPHVTESGYVGVDVHRAARIAAAAHGGQIVVSAATAPLVDGNELRDLGEHRFKDLAAAERVYQLGSGEFPPLQSLHQTNLPVPTTPFLGREREVDAVAQLLRSDDVRLLTLTGPGGTGKTRLALQAVAEIADHFPGGVWWVSLAPVRGPDVLLSTIAASLSVHPIPGEPIAAGLRGALSREPALVLLDNAEHLLPGIAVELASSETFGHATLLVTSRERLRIARERVYVVTSMTEGDAVELFLARTAQQGLKVNRTTDVEELCARLDALPLAVELAAARAALFTPAQLVERLGERLDLLEGGRDADPRQRTLRATMGWSHDLLTESERRVFARFSVFAGGATYDAAEQVCQADADTLQSLIDKSLLRRRDSAFGPRYWMLETIREYASLRVEQTAGAVDARRRHAEYYLAFVERATQTLVAGDATRGRWLDRIDDDIANIRAMLAWFADAPDHERQGRAAAALWRYWVSRDLAEGLAWLQGAAKLTIQPATRTRILHGLAVAATRVGKLELAQQAAVERVELHQGLDDDRGTADALVLLGNIAGDLGDFGQARSVIEAAVDFARKADDRTILAGTLTSLGYLALREDDNEEAASRSREAAALWGDLHRDDQVAIALINLASALLAQGKLLEARAALERGLRLAVELRDKENIAYCLDGLAAVEATGGDHRRAARLLGAADAIREATGTLREPYERVVSERMRSKLRRALRGEYDDAVASGRTLGAEQAAEYALTGGGAAIPRPPVQEPPP